MLRSDFGQGRRLRRYRASFRLYTLHFRGNDLTVHEEDYFQPHSSVENSDGVLRLEFRRCQKYGRRLHVVARRRWWGRQLRRASSRRFKQHGRGFLSGGGFILETTLLDLNLGAVFCELRGELAHHDGATVIFKWRVTHLLNRVFPGCSREATKERDNKFRRK